MSRPLTKKFHQTNPSFHWNDRGDKERRGPELSINLYPPGADFRGCLFLDTGLRRYDALGNGGVEIFADNEHILGYA
jgi:hypothetical protein